MKDIKYAALARSMLASPRFILQICLHKLFCLFHENSIILSNTAWKYAKAYLEACFCFSYTQPRTTGTVGEKILVLMTDQTFQTMCYAPFHLSHCLCHFTITESQLAQLETRVQMKRAPKHATSSKCSALVVVLFLYWANSFSQWVAITETHLY